MHPPYRSISSGSKTEEVFNQGMQFSPTSKGNPKDSRISKEQLNQRIAEKERNSCQDRYEQQKDRCCSVA